MTTVSVWLGGLDGTCWWEVDADAQHYAASLMKLPVAIAAERRHERGELDLDVAVPVHADLGSVVAGARFTMSRDDDQDDATWDAVGERVPLRELRRRSLALSGNLATDLLLEHTGLAEVAAVLADAGCGPGTVVARGIDDGPARDAGLQNLVTARDVGLLLGHLPAAVEDDLLGQVYRDGIPRGTPEDALVANKTGWVDGVTHDAALVRPVDSPPYALVVLTGHAAGDDARLAAEARIADVAREAWERRR